MTFVFLFVDSLEWEKWQFFCKQDFCFLEASGTICIDYLLPKENFQRQV